MKPHFATARSNTNTCKMNLYVKLFYRNSISGINLRILFQPIQQKSLQNGAHRKSNEDFHHFFSLCKNHKTQRLHKSLLVETPKIEKSRGLYPFSFQPTQQKNLQNETLKGPQKRKLEPNSHRTQKRKVDEFFFSVYKMQHLHNNIHNLFNCFSDQQKNLQIATLRKELRFGNLLNLFSSILTATLIKSSTYIIRLLQNI